MCPPQKKAATTSIRGSAGMRHRRERLTMVEISHGAATNSGRVRPGCQTTCQESTLENSIKSVAAGRGSNRRYI
ncbi:hypothetical protein MCHI_001333 [Candidatus Magnetoovum chiemensis]|nr:hypothetical protein MCHI_001333 [Candidatus Magnetoovum chiemensis]